MLKQRIVTALLLLPAVFLLLFNTPLEYFAAIILVVVYLMSLEWAKLSGYKQSVYCTFYALIVSTINLMIWHFSDALMFWPSISWPHYIQTEVPLLFLYTSQFVSFLAIVIVISYSKNKQWWQLKGLKEFFGLILLPTFFIAFISIRNIGYSVGDFYYGGKLLLFMLLLIWAADTGAFFTGKLLGKTKLTSVSPNKTWEGVIGGIVLSLVIGWNGVSILNLQVNNLYIYMMVILILAIVSVYGDLFESALKRVANIKDSGNLLPGHGGVLDRLDSTITVAPLFYLSFSYFEWFNG